MKQNLRLNLRLLLGILLLVLPGVGWAQSVIIAGWDVSNQTSYGTSPLSPTVTNANVIVSGLAREAGVATSGTAASRAWGGSNWAATSEAAITDNKLATFTVKPAPGNTLSLSAISQFDYRRSGTGPASGLLQYQINGGSFIDITTLSFPSTSSAGGAAGPISLSGISVLQNIPASSTVTFRIIPFAASGTGTWYIFDRANSVESDLALVGTVSPVATPVAALTINPTSLSEFSTMVGTASASQSYSLSAGNLTESITITAPTGAEVSTDNVSFSASVTLPSSTTNTTVYARLTGVSAGPVNGVITHQSGTLSANLDISGTVTKAAPAGAAVVISQVYGGGGNSGAIYKNDFIELYNRSAVAVDLSGWSVQYSSSSGSSWQVTSLSGTIKPGGYFLIQQGAGSGGTTDLPTPDAIGTINMSGTNGKVALVNATSALSGTCPTGTPVVDFVGFGSANCSETAPTPTLSNTTAAIRKGEGATDTDNNAADFVTGAPAPRNGALPTGPTLVATPASLSGTNSLYYVEGSGPDNKTISVNGSLLAPASGTITVSSSSSAFTVSPSTITYSEASLSTTAVTVQMVPGLGVGLYSGTITLSGGGTTLEVPVNGVVNSNSPFTPISIARAAIGQTFTIAGRVTVTNQLGARQIYIQDATGGIMVYSGPTGPDFTTMVQLGDSVEVSGPISVFNGFTEITGTDNFTVITGVENRIPAPRPISLDQLADYQGQLVQIINPTITPEAATFAGNTNYTITADGKTAAMRINANSPLSGAGKPANPLAYATGIADRFVTGATTPGVNGLQLQPRILDDIPGATAPQDLICTVPGPVSTLPLDKTLDIASWNMEFFGADGGTIICPNGNLNYNDLGPVNEDLQQTNAITVLNKLNADIIAVQEMSDINRLAATVAALPGKYSYLCSDKFSYYFQDDCNQTPTGNPPTVFGPNSLAQKVCVIYNTETVTPLLAETQALFDGEFNYPSANNWSSGRLPFLFVADATIDGVTRRIHVVDIHAKSGSATSDYNRRKQDIELLKARLDARYPDANLVLLGDFNDKLNGSIAAGRESSYQSFVTDIAGYTALTLPLENQGCTTFNSSISFIDHIVVSNELNAAYVENSAYVLQPFSIPNFGNTTSDHNPVVARFDLSKLSTPITSLTVSTTQAAICSNGSSQLSATVTGGGAPYSYTWTGPGTITNPAAASTEVSGLTAGEQTFTVTVTDVYNQTASTVVTISVAAQPEIPTLAHASAVQGTANVVLTAANCTGVLVWTGATTGTGTSLEVSSATPGQFDYSVQCKVEDCVSEATSVSVTIIPLLTATVAASPEAILTNESSTLTASVSGGTPAYAYEWTGPGTIANANTPMATVSNLTPGEKVFTVKITDATLPTAQVVTKSVSVFVTQANRAPIAAAIPNQTATAGNNVSLDIKSAFTDPDNDALTYTASGLPAGLTLANGVISGMPTTEQIATVTITAVDPGALSASASFTFTVVQGPLKMLSPTYTCEAGQLNVNVIAGNGNAIEYQIPSVSKGWESKTTYPIEARHIGKELKIRARQRASDGKGYVEVETSFTPTACAANARIGLPETEMVSDLTMTLLGNPATDQVTVEVRGVEGQTVQLRLMNLQGRVFEARTISNATEVERHTFDIQRQAPEILLLQVTTPGQQKAVKVVKQ